MIHTDAEFLAAIAANPDDDTVRLVYADWLDEHDQPERAEFIRVQCELARRPGYSAVRLDLPPVEGNSDYYREAHALRVREAALFAANEAAWRAGPVCEKCRGEGFRTSHVRAVDCPACNGTGDAGGLLRKFTTGRIEDGTSETNIVTVRYERGMKVVEVPRLEDVITWDRVGNSEDMSDRHDEYRPTDWLAAVLRHHPDVEAVVPLTDYLYDVEIKEGVAAYFVRTSAIFDHECVPKEVYPNGNHEDFPSADLARLALGRTVVQFGWSSLKAPQTTPD